MFIELAGVLFMTAMFLHLVWNIQKKLDGTPKTELELWTEQYRQDVPTVWNNQIPDGQNVFRKHKGLVLYKFLSQ